MIETFSCGTVMWLELKHQTHLSAHRFKHEHAGILGPKHPKLFTIILIPMLKALAIFVWHEKKIKIPWLTLPCFIDTSWGTLSVLPLAKQWAAVSTQFGLRIDPKQSGFCKGGKCSCVKIHSLTWRDGWSDRLCKALTLVTVTLTCQGLVWRPLFSSGSFMCSCAIPHIVTLLSPVW